MYNIMCNIACLQALSARFSLIERHKKRGYINCNLLISRAESEI